LPIIGQTKATPIERILKVTHQGAAPGAKSDIYDSHVGKMQFRLKRKAKRKQEQRFEKCLLLIPRCLRRTMDVRVCVGGM